MRSAGLDGVAAERLPHPREQAIGGAEFVAAMRRPGQVEGSHGVRHLVLTSRRGLEAPGARELVQALEKLGKLREMGINPYPYRFAFTHDSAGLQAAKEALLASGEDIAFADTLGGGPHGAQPTRMLAGEHNDDLAAIIGTGPGGRFNLPP